MFGGGGLALTAGPIYTDATMGQGSSVVERDRARRASSTILREDSIQVEESAQFDTPESYFLNCDYTSQAPYTRILAKEDMHKYALPKRNPSHDLAEFLRNTSPTAPYRQSGKMEQPNRTVSNSKNAFRFFKVGGKRSNAPVMDAHQNLNDILHDEGGLLSDTSEKRHLPPNVRQKVSATGKKYLALTLPDIPEIRTSDSLHRLDDDQSEADTQGRPKSKELLTIGSDILESRVSVLFADDELRSSDALDAWFFNLSEEQRKVSPISAGQASAGGGAEAESQEPQTIRLINYSSPSPVRPAASNPPTPQPESAVSIADSYQVDLNEHPAKNSMDGFTSYPKHTAHAKTDSTTRSAAHNVPLPQEEFPVKIPNLDKVVEIKHPSPRRFASHPVLLHRTSSTTSPIHPRSYSDSPGPAASGNSPGPPPPKSPLRLRRDARTIDSTMSPVPEIQRLTPRTAPSIRGIDSISSHCQPIVPTVVTECTGPLTRPRSREQRPPVKHLLYPHSRKDREERIKARKVRDRPYTIRTIDAIVNTPPSSPRQRLKKARPHIQIPDRHTDLRPAPLATRASSTASSNASWRKVTETTLTSISSRDDVEESTEASPGEPTGYTPISPTTYSSKNSHADSKIGLSPVMLMAEEVPIPKTQSPLAKPAKLIISKEKPFTPRPRSASMSRSAARRRSRTGTGVYTPSRPSTPTAGKDDTPPLPSPPPTRALPPTPPGSGSEKKSRSKASASTQTPSPGRWKKDLPNLPTWEISPRSALLNQSPHARTPHMPHVATQDSRIAAPPSSSLNQYNRDGRFHARLEALEKQNALLSAALIAVLKTNGTLNGPLTAVELDSPRSPMTWESRVTRRSEATGSHAASSSNGSALEMYMNTRRSSVVGN